MDDLSYTYDVAGAFVSNKLLNVDDAVATPGINNDLEDQATSNYSYDASGNLIQDVKEGIDYVTSTADGKISRIDKSGSSIMSIEFLYDGSGNRVKKRVYYVTPPNQSKVSYYMRAADGKILAIYEYDIIQGSPPVDWEGAYIALSVRQCITHDCGETTEYWEYGPGVTQGDLHDIIASGLPRPAEWYYYGSEAHSRIGIRKP